MYDRKAASIFLGRSVSRLVKDAKAGVGCPSHKMGRLVRYLGRDIRQTREACRLSESAT
jgi:hypothetical protein